ncbi:MAG: S-layer homology domain-containing protein [Lachnospiraceae bacterium]|nr:S-layer homology domain-containing protein [Lachnospiraceae bacterium]
MKKRILSVLLVLSMVITLLPVTARAGVRINNVMLGIRGINGEQQNSIYFGKYGSSPIEWLVLADSDGNDGTYEDQDDETVDSSDAVFLLSKYTMGTSSRFGADYNWNESDIKSEFQDLYNSLFDEKEKPEILKTSTTLDQDVGGSSDSPYLNASQLDDDILFLLSAYEATRSDYGFDEWHEEDDDRIANTGSSSSSTVSWWLRSSGEAVRVNLDSEIPIYEYYVGQVNSLGVVGSEYSELYLNNRPAFNFNSSSVLFSTAADFDNSQDLIQTERYNDSDWKFTLSDGNNSFAASMDDTTIPQGDTAVVDISSLGSGTGYTQISAMLLSDEYVYAYGKIGDASEGEISFAIPADFISGDYTLRLFAEDVNGAYFTDYASNVVDVPISITEVYSEYSIGSRIKLTDESIWIVLEDSGAEYERFTLVKDGFLSEPYTRVEADTAISTYQDDARQTFEDDAATAGLVSIADIEILSDLGVTLRSSNYYWFADYLNGPGYVANSYMVGSGTSFIGSYSPEYAANIRKNVRPVLTVLKSAFLAIEPVITSQPETLDLLRLDGEQAVFSVAATGTNLTYQWQVNGSSGWSDLGGETENTLTLDSNDGNYENGKTFRCAVYSSDWGETIYSDEADLAELDWQRYGEAYAQPGTDYIISADESVITIQTAAGFGWIASQVNNDIDNFAEKTVELRSDLDLSDRMWIPIGNYNPFEGNFNGNMHEISSLAINFSGNAVGLFGFVENSLLENLIITDGTLEALGDDTDETYNNWLGVLCGYSLNSTIRNIGVGAVNVSSAVNNDEFLTGGIVGCIGSENPYDCVYNSYSRAILSGGENAAIGGIIGSLANDSVENCYFAGSITSVTEFQGTIVGYADNGIINSCYWLDTLNINAMYDAYGSVDENCASKTTEQMKESAFAALLNSWVTVENTTAGSDVYKTWFISNSKNSGYPGFIWVDQTSSDDDSYTYGRTIAVTELSSDVFNDIEGSGRAKADMANAFSSSVEVKITDTDEKASSFGFGDGDNVYPFDISLYIQGTNIKTQPNNGYSVTIYLPIPDGLLDSKDKLFVVHKSDNGEAAVLDSWFEQINGIWYIVFEAAEFSPYALVVNNYEPAGLPYYIGSDGNEVFIGFAANGKYIAPSGTTVFFKENPKNFTDISGHWAMDYISFVTEREIFAGTGSNRFSPDTGMTRAMFAAIIGRMYERSYGEIIISDAHAFIDCNYDDYYGKYVDWAAENNIIGGYGNGSFGPDDLVTREQMTAILYRFADFLGALPSDMDTVLNYPDADSISHYAKNAVLYCQTTNIISGRDGGTFAPQETATRAEVAAIIEQFVESIMA